MKQVLQATDALAVVRDVPAPPCPAGGVVVRTAFSVISSGTERTRVELSQKSLLGKARERPDLVREVVARARREGIGATRVAVERRLAEETPVGYSCAGTVIEVGRMVRGLAPGDRVACAGGGHANHAELVSVPRNLCAKVPDRVSLEAAAFSTIAAVALHSVRLADVRLGERVAVIGCGLVGQIACRLLSCAGAEVFALDLDQERVDHALRGGADHGLVAGGSAAAAVWAMTGGVGVDAVVVTAAASSSEPLLTAAKVARDRGTVILVGAVPVEFPRAPLYDKELVFRISRSYGPGRYDLEYEERGLDYPIGFVRWTEQRNMESVLDLQARGRLALADLIDEVVPVDRATEAYERLLSSRLRGAIVISYGDGDGEASASRGAPAGGPAAADVAEAQGDRDKGAVSGQPRVGLVGPGGFAGRVIVPALVAAGAGLELVGGGSGPSAEAAGRNLGFARVAESPGDLIADASVDVVVICTRHGSHARLAVEALAADKHVFCEKPLALDRDELSRVIAAAHASRGILAVGFNRRFAPLLGELKRFVRGVQQPSIACYRVSAGRIASDHWVHDLEQGGGRALGEVCHFVDSLVYVVDSPVVSVHATGYGQSDLPRQAHDNLVLTLAFADGSAGSVVYAADGSGRVPKERLEVFCGPRTGILDDYRAVELFGGENRKAGSHNRTQDKGHRAEIAAFVEGMRNGQYPVALAEIENVSLATLAIVESLRTGTTVDVARS